MRSRPISDFAFDLPPELIAQHPTDRRDGARLLVVGDGNLPSPSEEGRGEGAALQDAMVTDLPTLLSAGDILVVNDTRVIPAQLTAYRDDARLGVTLDQPLPDGTWHVLLRNARRVHTGDVLRIAGAPLSARVERREDGGGAVLRFDRAGADFDAALARAGALALPPYIARPDGPTPADAVRYQTVFADAPGAVAAPTAGLHFTDALLDALRARGVRLARLTLHVGAGTFLPVRDLASHTMHAERAVLTQAAADAINAARREGGRIVAVGTTSARTLETAADADGVLHAFEGTTDIFIKPGHRFRAVDLLLTNFHLPASTLFMLVCAFAGTQRMRAAYAHAIAERYRFYSYGDACLLSAA